MGVLSNDFERIYADNYRQIYAFLYKLCRDPYVSEDLTQETFFQAYLSLHRYNGRCSMFTWLAAIAKNLFFNYLRKTKAETLAIDLYVTEPESPLTEEPGHVLKREIEISRVRQAISELPKKYSDVLILRIYGELSYEEIAAKLGISVNSARVIYYRAKNFMKEKLINDEL